MQSLQGIFYAVARLRLPFVEVVFDLVEPDFFVSFLVVAFVVAVVSFTGSLRMRAIFESVSPLL